MKIICIGRNFVEHAKEMNAPLPKSPIFFLKPDTSILRTSNFYHPKFSNNIQYECELVIKINKVRCALMPQNVPEMTVTMNPH